MSADYIATEAGPIYRHHVTKWLRQQQNTEHTQLSSGLVCVHLNEQWAVLVMSKHGQGPHINVLLADLESALGMSRARILDGVEHGKTIMQMRFEMERDANTKTSKE